MKKLSTFLFLAILSFMTWAQDYDFQVDQLCYNFNDENPTEVTVTYQQDPSSGDPTYPSLSGALTIPSTVTCNGTTYTITSIGAGAFRGCSSLTSVTIPEGVTSIGAGAFRGCSSLTSVSIPEGVTSIGYSAFQGCSSLTSVTIPEGVTSIGDYAFQGCSSLTSVSIPNSVTSIEHEAFRDCSSLASVIIPEGVTSIGDYAFRGCSSLISVTIPEGVTSIGGAAFHSCSSLTSVTIPTGVTSIETGTFVYCFSLTSVTIPEGVISVGDFAFQDCHSLASVTIPTSVTSIGVSAFAFTALEYDASNWANNVLYIDNCLIDAKSELSGAYDIVAGTRVIAAYAFNNCSSLTSVTIPNSVTSIGDGAFRGCSSLTSVSIPNSVTSIGHEAFRDCSSLASVTIPEGVTSIGYAAFQDCSSLTSVTIPNSVTSIGKGAFIGTALYNNQSNWVNNVLYIDNCLIEAKTELSGAYDIVAGTRIIAAYAFNNCSSLTSVTIPNSVTSIGYNAFEGCSSLTEMIVLATTPPTTDTYSFDNIDRSITLYVPVASIEAYRTDDGWRYFTNILPVESLTHKQLEIKIDGNGIIQYGETTLSKDTALYIEPETQITLQLLSAEGYAITQVLYNGNDYTSNVTADGTLTLSAIIENGTLVVQFTELPFYTISYYVEGNDAYFENDVISGGNFTLRAKPYAGKSIQSVTLNGVDITSQLEADGTITLYNITEEQILVVSTEDASSNISSSTSSHLSAWQANGTIFAEVNDNVATLQLYDVSGRLMNEYRHNGNYQVITLPAPNEVNILKVVGKDGSITAHKLM